MRVRKNCSTNGRGRIARPTGEEELLDQRERKNCSTNGRGRIAHLKNEGEEELHFQHSNREILK
jgi:hypothetical protein